MLKASLSKKHELWEIPFHQVFIATMKTIVMLGLGDGLLLGLPPYFKPIPSICNRCFTCLLTLTLYLTLPKPSDELTLRQLSLEEW